MTTAIIEPRTNVKTLTDAEIRTKTAIHRLRVNVKSLTAEARFIRHEIKRTGWVVVKNELHSHRSSRVKPEARLAHLALAYLRGTPYKAAENFTKNKPSANELMRKLKRFDRVELSSVIDWLGA
jgi:hypothetical protein